MYSTRAFKQGLQFLLQSRREATKIYPQTVGLLVASLDLEAELSLPFPKQRLWLYAISLSIASGEMPSCCEAIVVRTTMASFLSMRVSPSMVVGKPRRPKPCTAWRQWRLREPKLWPLRRRPRHCWHRLVKSKPHPPWYPLSHTHQCTL